MVMFIAMLNKLLEMSVRKKKCFYRNKLNIWASSKLINNYSLKWR